jgi:hypothetical protein
MTAVIVPAAPPLARISHVELLHAGSYDISTGPATFTTDDLAAAVGALDCPAVRRPLLKLGHTDPRFDGEPAVGWIDNLATAEGGRTLVGDYVGMPGWLGDVITSAYPDRSVEGRYDFRCQTGHTHPFVLTAVALLGVTAPGVGTLGSLQDVARLYGVEIGPAEPLIPADDPIAAAAGAAAGTPFTVICKGATPMPNPNPAQVAAGVSVEDVRRDYYDDANWSRWITAVELEPLQLIVCDDNDGKYYRVPVVVDGDTFTFSDEVEVVIVYQDVPAKPAAGTPANAAAADAGRIVFASRAESRPGADPAASDVDPAEPSVEPAATAAPDLSTFCALLGLPDDADEATITAAIEELSQRADAAPEPAVAAGTPVLPPGVVAVEQSTLDELRVVAQNSQRFVEEGRVKARDDAIAEALRVGKIAPSRADHWRRSWDADPEGAKETLASLAPGLTVPVGPALGYAGEPDPGERDDEFARLFPPTR